MVHSQKVLPYLTTTDPTVCSSCLSSSSAFKFNTLQLTSYKMPRRRKEASTSSVSTSRRNFSFKSGHSEEFKEKPQQRNAANARERARMRVLSRAFCRLKTTLPWVPADTKLSKLDTLRLATTYIGHLRAVLVEGSSTTSPPLPSHPLSMSWPFMFNKSNDPTDSSLSGSESPSSTSDQYTCKDFDPEEQLKMHLSDASPSNSFEMAVHHQTYQQPYSSMHELGYSDHLMELH